MIKNIRLSNIELLRIIAIFFIMVYHINHVCYDMGSIHDIYNGGWLYGAYLMDSLSIICVDVFVLISGWFGLRPSVKSVCNLLFQCFFFWIGIYILLLLTHKARLSVEGVLGCFGLLKSCWFVKAYIGLLLLAPMLNAFIEKTSKRTIEIWMILFFIFQTLYSWLTGAAQYFLFGFSSMSFVGLYMLGRYTSIYAPKFSKMNVIADMSVILIILILQLCLAIFSMSMNSLYILNRVYCYVSPFVILESLYFVLVFSKFSFQSKTINFIATSSFAVFLLHAHPIGMDVIFKSPIIEIYSKYSGIVCALISICFMIFLYCIGVLLDQPRKLLWNYICSYIIKKK